MISQRVGSNDLVSMSFIKFPSNDELRLQMSSGVLSVSKTHLIMTYVVITLQILQVFTKDPELSLQVVRSQA